MQYRDFSTSTGQVDFFFDSSGLTADIKTYTV
jgi:hypothetical protein